jgi:hypothetical protein
MSFDLSTVGFTTPPYALAYDWKLLATYALGIGAKRDELEYLYENAPGGMKVYPTFAVVPSYGPVMDLLTKCNTDMAMVVHGGQLVRIRSQTVYYVLTRMKTACRIYRDRLRAAA